MYLLHAPLQKGRTHSVSVNKRPQSKITERNGEQAGVQRTACITRIHTARMSVKVGIGRLLFS